VAAAEVDAVVVATPIDLGRLISLDKPSTRVRYEIEFEGETSITDVLAEFVEAKMA
jgi:predicted GTPase